MNEPISKNIRAHRIAQGMTQEELAAKVFTTRQTVSNYETGKSKPDYEMIEKIAAVLGVDEETLLYDMGDRRKKLLWGIAVITVFLFTLARSLRFSSLISQLDLPIYLTYAQAYNMIITPVTCCVLGWFLVRFYELYIRKREFHFNRSEILLVILAMLLIVWFLIALMELPKIYAAASDPVKNAYGGPAMLSNYLETFYYKCCHIWEQLPVLNSIFVFFGGFLAVCKNGK